MPELPEVQTTVNGLSAKVLNRAFVDVWSDWEKLVKKPKSFFNFKKELNQKKILRIWRRGKNIIFDLSGGMSLLIHLKMTGHLLVGKWERQKSSWLAIKNEALNEKINGYLHIIFFLDNGQMIALSDVRKFARIDLVKKEELDLMLSGIGPEPLEEKFTVDKFINLFVKKHGKVKQVIMDPKFIAGVGNIYASEALWEAKIHPTKDVSKLKPEELKLLYKAIRKVLSLGIKFGGDSFSDYRDVDGLKGKFEGQKKVYQRSGQKCYRCKTIIQKIVIGQRGSFFCSKRQTL